MKRLFDIPLQAARSNPHSPAISQKKEGEWAFCSYMEYLQNVDSIAKGLIGLGVQKGDRIATISANRPEWNFIDMAVMKCGAIHVPLFPTFGRDDLQFVLNDCGARFVFVNGRLLFSLVNQVLPELPSLEKVLTIDTVEGISENLVSILRSGIPVPASELRLRAMEVLPSDLATISYSSGTYWRPFGAEVTHAALHTMAESLAADYGLRTDDKAMSCLPLCHSYERGHNLAYQMAGVHVSYANSTTPLIENIQQVSPTFLTSVPVLLEGVFNQLVEMTSSHFPTEVFNNAIDYAYQFEAPSGHFRGPDQQIGEVLKEWRLILGEQLRCISSAGAPMPEHLANAFWAMGIPLLECYGMTETQIICLNNPKKSVQSGTVGPPQGDVNVRLSSDGEILVKSPYIMQGYHNNSSKTYEAIDPNGWFSTGDLGQWDGDCLRIIGRKKVVFKVANGKYLSPEMIEGRLRKSDYIHQALVHEVKGKAVAIIIPVEKIKTQNTELLTQTIADEVDRLYNDHVPIAERISDITLRLEPWTIETGELTPNMKIRRSVIFNAQN